MFKYFFLPLFNALFYLTNTLTQFFIRQILWIS